MTLVFITFSELVLYPWGGKDEGVGGQDEAIFKKMAADIVKMNNYTPMQSSDLYIASGDTCDWLYGELSVYCLTFELSPSSMFGGGFYPGASMIERVFDDNFEPMLYLADLAEDPSRVLQTP
jgi:carboxypeptidase T